MGKCDANFSDCNGEMKDGCEVDQFEQHIRAVAGWPLGDTTPAVSVEMTNLLGDEVLDWREMTARYLGASIRLLEGGDHALSNFDAELPHLLGFLGLQR